MLNFEGFSISIHEVTDGFECTTYGHGTRFFKKAKNHHGLIKEAKLECLKILVNNNLQSCFIVEKTTGKIIYKNEPMIHQELSLSGFDVKSYREGVAIVECLENNKPVTIAIAVLDYGSYLKCQIESIKYALVPSEAHQ